MKLVPQASLPPFTCAVTGRNEGPFIDTLMTLPVVEPRVYVSIEGAKRVGAVAGMKTEEEHQAVIDERDALAVQVAELQERLEALRELEESVKYTLRWFGQEDLKRKPGPKAVV